MNALALEKDFFYSLNVFVNRQGLHMQPGAEGKM